MSGRRRNAYGVLGCWSLVTIAACGGSASGPSPKGSCTPATVSLAPLHGVTLDCSTGSGLTLDGNGATYLIVPQFATGNVAYQFQNFTLNRRQALFDLHLRRKGQRLAAAAASMGPMAPGPAAAVTVGSTRTFWVFADTNATTYKLDTATLQFAGANVYVYVDNAAPANGFSPTQLQTFGQLTDQVLYQLDVTTFAAPTDIDHNGHVIMLLSPAVNALTPANDCRTEGFVAGYFDPNDLAPGNAHSNQGEVFYGIVPDPDGTAHSCAHLVADVDGIIPGTFLHELQHMINYGHHVLINGGSAEEGWLDEGMSIVATELGARYYNAKHPPANGRIFTDSAVPYIEEQLNDSYDYLANPDTASLTLHTDADCCLEWRGGDWLLMRYLGDQKGDPVFHALETSTATGTANIAQASGLPFSVFFGNFGIAAYTDSIPGVARSAIPAPYRFTSYNLRDLYALVHNIYPLLPATLTSAGLSGKIVPGTSAYYQLATPAGSGSVSLTFGGTGGGVFPASLHPQVNVFRLE